MLGIQEGRNPAPVDQLRIAAAVIPVQMRAQDVVSVLGLQSGLGERVETYRRVAHSPPLRFTLLIGLVEPDGIEPTTSSMRLRQSSFY
jgi:hypothetical protein